MVATSIGIAPEELLAELHRLPAPAFASRYVLDRVPWVFDDDRLAYISWKEELGSAIEVDPCGILIVGSAATCVSLSPKKDLARFHEKSDVDVAIISGWHFDVAWKWLRSVAADLDIEASAKKAVDAHRRNLVFDGTIATDQFIAHLPFAQRWVVALAQAGAKDPLAGRVVNARLYRDFDSLREYQLRGIRRIQQGTTTEEKPEPI